MFPIALGFVAGAWLLQKQTNLPSLPIIAFTVLSASIYLLGVKLLLNKSKVYSTLQTISLFMMAFVVGYLYAASSAEKRLSDALPNEWE